MFTPSYLVLHERGELINRVEALAEYSRPCRLCPHACGAERTKESLGVCGCELQIRVSGAFAHFGEEPPLVGRLGSGTIFFCGCNLRCCFCQNWDISHGADPGHALTDEELARLMIELQLAGCHNINLVTPTHYIHSIVAAVELAAAQGLSLPLVYNCGGYESTDVLKLLEGVVDIYMPDTKYSDEEAASKYSDARNYPEVNRKALLEMHNQVGTLQIQNGIATRGLLIRHLVLPHNLSGPFKTLDFIAHRLSKDSYVNIMAQYRPCYMAEKYSELSKKITFSDYSQVTEYARKLGLKRGF